ncbi:type I restriction enzyme M protein [Micromonospora matsumotoense]|uniref:Type I restriction enzyme M protein n=1 Tax=Micromonospora matsumotoense TaxID=121616 RepID=A0A1C4YA54_9ACTN|nr:N-6 DNA methylase [Micromonospora matsumotoense]SCF17623.1 type I restriction enzyme M protein [Micromonospora matsumotoense]
MSYGPGELTPSPVTVDAAVGRINEAIWHGFDRCRGLLSVSELGDVVLVLLYLRGRPAWQALVSGASDAEQALRSDLSADRESPALLRPLLDSVRKADDMRQLAPLVEVVNRLDPDGQAPPAQVFSAVLERVGGLTTRKGTGEFHTPRAITELSAGLLDPTGDDQILDPCCKAGGFLTAIVDRLMRQGKALDRLAVTISDYSLRSCALAYLQLRLRGLTPQVLPSVVDSLPTGAADNEYDVVTANPPFNLPNWIGDDRFRGRWWYGSPPAHNSNFAWLQYVIASLKPGGRAAVVMPYGAGLSENTQERNIRAAMLDDGVVSAVIALPGQMFAGTDIPVTLWLLQRSPTPRPAEVLFIDANELGSIQQRRRTLGPTDIDRIVDAYRDWREHSLDPVAGFVAAVPIEKLRSDGYRLNPRAYIPSINEAPDLRTRAREVGELTRRLDQLAEQAAHIDRTIEEHLKELSL